MIISAKIDVTKILKDLLFKGKTKTIIDKNGIEVLLQPVYLDISLLTNKDGKDQYENDGMVVQSIPRERREAGEKGPILGNFRIVKHDAPAPVSSYRAQVTEHSEAKGNGYAPSKKDDDLPF